MNAPQTPYERFMAQLPAHAANRGAGANWPAYVRIKQHFERVCPDSTPEQYEAAMRAIARATGV